MVDEPKGAVGVGERRGRAVERDREKVIRGKDRRRARPATKRRDMVGDEWRRRGGRIRNVGVSPSVKASERANVLIARVSNLVEV